MKIEAIRLRNFMCFEDTGKIELSSKINIFVGANNSGKSSVLKALYALQKPDYVSKNDIRINCSASYVHYYTDTNDTESVKIIDIEKLKKEIEDSKKHDDFQTEMAVRDELNYLFQNITTELFMQIDSSRVILGFLSRDVNPQNGDSYIHRIYVSPQRPSNYIVPFFTSRKTEKYNLEIKQEMTTTITENFKNLPALIDRVSTPDYYKKFKKYCKKILNIELYTHNEGDGKQIKYKIDNRNYIHIENLGDGVPIIIAFIANLITLENKLYLIEELENDLHPKALKELLNLIIEYSDKNQFVITTHSNIVLRHLGAQKETKILEVSQLKTKRIPTSKIKLINSEAEKRRVLADLGYELEDFGLWNAWLLLEEASIETIINNFIIPYFFPKLSSKLRTFSSGGVDNISKKFKNLEDTFVYLDMSEQYHNKVWVLIDKGIDKNSAETKLIENLNKVFVQKERKGKEKWSSDNFMMLGEHDFELYYPEEFKTKEEINKILSLPRSRKKEKKEKKEKLLKNFIDWINKKGFEERKRIVEKYFKEIIEKIAIIEKKLTK